RIHRADETDIVGMRSGVRDEIGKLGSALAVRLELARAGEHRGVGFRESQPEVLGHGGGQRFAVPFLQLRFGIEEVELAGTALHEHDDDVLSLRGKVRLFWGERVHLRNTCAALHSEQMRHSDRADAARAVPEKSAAALDSTKIFEIHCYSRFINSSRFSSTRPTPTQAAASVSVTLSTWFGNRPSASFTFCCKWPICW